MSVQAPGADEMVCLQTTPHRKHIWRDYRNKTDKGHLYNCPGVHLPTFTPKANIIQIYQEDIWLWSEGNFGDAEECPSVVAVVGLAEEAGEVCRAVLKQHQGIRGTAEEWQAEIEKELGDVFIKLCDVASRSGIDLFEAIDARWHDVSQRNWKRDPKGHGI